MIVGGVFSPMVAGPDAPQVGGGEVVGGRQRGEEIAGEVGLGLQVNVDGVDVEFGDLQVAVEDLITFQFSHDAINRWQSLADEV